MNKSPIPKWPLYVADAAMLAAVFAIAYPNIVLMETMSAAGILLCSLLCAGAMAMVLAPFAFEYLNQKQRISSDARKARADIDLIFENLSALQLMIAETREMGDSIEEKLAFQLAKDTDIKFESFNNALEDLRNLTKTDVKAASDKAAEMLESLAQTDARIAELSAEVARLADSREAQTLEAERVEKKYEEVLDELDALKNDVAAVRADIEQSQKHAREMREFDAAVANAADDDFDIVSDEEPDNIDIADNAGESAEDEGSDFSGGEMFGEEAAEEVAEEPAEEAENFESADDSENSVAEEAKADGEFEEDESDFDSGLGGANVAEDFDEGQSESVEEPAEAEGVEDSDEEPEVPAPERETKNRLEGLMQKALNNAASNAWSVEKIISGSGAAHGEDAQNEDVDAPASAETPEEESGSGEVSADIAESDDVSGDVEVLDLNEADSDPEAAATDTDGGVAAASDVANDNSAPDPIQDSDFAEEKIDDTLLDGLDFDEQSDPEAESVQSVDSVAEAASVAEAEAAPKVAAKPAQKADGENLSEVAPEADSASESKHEKVAAAQVATADEDLLFDNAELPQSKKPAYKKGASITLRSMIGIGNKPYLRGNIAPLSPDKGVEMDYAEIGVWKLPLPDFDGELAFTVWKNDEEQIGEPSYTAESGQKTEITI